MYDSSFELKFSQLADSRLQEKVPSLYPYRVGFQLIDKNEDDTKGVGVMAFVLDGSWLYAPVFFIKGNLKGMELLYVKNKDLFIPLKDSWISFVKKGEAATLGEGKDRQQVRSKKPDMIHLMLSPQEKISKEQDSLIDKDTLCMMMTKLEAVQRDLTTELPKLGKESFQEFVRSMEKDAAFAEAIFKFYKPEDLRKIAEKIDDVNVEDASGKSEDQKTRDVKVEQDSAEAPKSSIIDAAIAKSKGNTNVVKEEKILLEAEPNEASRSDDNDEPKAPPINANKETVTKEKSPIGTVQVVTSSKDENAKGLSDKEKEILMRDGVFVKDDRSSTTTVFNTDVKNYSFTNPTESGIYDVLLADGKTSPMLIVFPNTHFKKVEISHSGFRANAERRVCPNPEVAVIDLSEPKEFRMIKVKEILGVPTQRLDETVYNKVKNIPEFTRKTYLSNKSSCYLVMDKKRNACVVRFPWDLDGRMRYNKDSDSLPVDHEHACIKFTGNDGKLSVQRDMLYIPAGAVGFPCTQASAPFMLGNVNTFLFNMKKTAGLEDMKIYSDRNGFAITVGNEKKSTQKMNLSKTAALIYLVKDQAISAPLAKKMLKEASDNLMMPKSKRYLLKYAANTNDIYELQTGQPGESRRTAQKAPLEQANKLMPAQALRTATNASNEGMKEVLDTSVLASLVGTSHSMELMGSYLTDLTKAMDKVGRMLFLYYWHNDEFKDQYGAQELVELEESLRDVFDSVGDLVLFIREKSVDFDSLFTGSRTDISEDIGDADTVGT
jgi:hypothetical protein